MINHNFKLKLFSGRANMPLAEKIAEHLGDTLGRISLANFPDGEISLRIDEDVRGKDIFIIQPTCPPVNENLMELLVMMDSFKRASAARITAVLPYYGYARQDRKDVGRVPITAKLVANLITSAGAERVLTLDLHAAQIQGFFDIPVDHLQAAPVINEYIRATLPIQPKDFVVLSPDEGSIKRVLVHQKRLGGSIAIVDKRRSSATETQQANIIGASLEGKVAIIFDDMISTGSSVVGAAEVARSKGVKELYVCATHPILCGDAIDKLRKAPIKQIIVTDSIPIPAYKRLPNFKVVSVAPLLAEAIRRIHLNESVSKLFE